MHDAGSTYTAMLKGLSSLALLLGKPMVWKNTSVGFLYILKPHPPVSLLVKTFLTLNLLFIFVITTRNISFIKLCVARKTFSISGLIAISVTLQGYAGSIDKIMKTALIKL